MRKNIGKSADICREGRQQLYREEDLQDIDPDYFSIITKSEHDVTLQFRNTGHWWYLHCTDYPTNGFTLIYHKHQFGHSFYEHYRKKTLQQAVKSIKEHDSWMIRRMK